MVTEQPSREAAAYWKEQVMRSAITSTWGAVVTALIFAISIVAQSGRDPQKGGESKRASPSEAERSNDQQGESVKIETALVTVPVIASDRNDVYVPDMRQDDFTIYEDGVKQELAFFAAIKEPFHVVLMLDTSGSTQEKLGQIKRAATAFVQQLQPADRVKIISFDDVVRELSDFTNDRAALQRAIEETRPGQGTKLYDAVRLALTNLERVKGRKAIVLFTDGVDWHSDTTRYDDNMRAVEESGVIVYPIRYDTRTETEALVRRQQEAGEAVDLGTIFGGPRGGTTGGSTPPTVPGGGGTPVPTGRPSGQRSPYGLPIPPVIITPPNNRYPGGGRYPDDRYPGGGRYPDDRYPSGGRYPDDRYPSGGRYPDDRYPDSRYPDSRNDPTSRRRRDDSVSVMLDGLYKIADDYLNDLAAKSGGKLHRADTLGSLPAAFAQIAAELRNQYSLGYYPANEKRDGKYRRVVVRTSRKGVILRARPGYRAPSRGA